MGNFANAISGGEFEECLVLKIKSKFDYVSIHSFTS